MHKQIPGLKAQVGVITKVLTIVEELGKSAEPYEPGAPFPARMTATAVIRCLNESRRLLENALATLTTELDFYEKSDERITTLQAAPETDEKTAALSEIKAVVGDREADTAGEAVFAMQSIPAALAFLAKVIENDRRYRGDLSTQGPVHKQIPGLNGQLNVLGTLFKLLEELETTSPALSQDAPFPVKMTAESVGLCLGEARRILTGAQEILQTELSFFKENDRKVAAINDGTDGDETKAAAIKELSTVAGSREALTAGRASFAMQSLTAVLGLIAKAMENNRNYRG